MYGPSPPKRLMGPMSPVISIVGRQVYVVQNQGQARAKKHRETQCLEGENGH